MEVTRLGDAINLKSPRLRAAAKGLASELPIFTCHSQPARLLTFQLEDKHWGQTELQMRIELDFTT